MTDPHLPQQASLAARAWQAFTAGDPSKARHLAATATTAARTGTRHDRQRTQIVELAVTGEADRAAGLAAEHLTDYPGDQLIKAVRQWAERRRRGV
ncbi:MAG: hypothetical protein WAL72_09160 [Streptosporangiaceae bacterium]